jgi:tRNA(Arg) A34 adenosine deaminase TadA
MPPARDRRVEIVLSRRRLLGGLSGLGAMAAGLPMAAGPRAARAQAPSLPEIVQPPRAARAHFMQRALDLRQRAQAAGDQPYGAVVVREGRIVGEGASRVVTTKDPTAHAEMEAIRDACRRLQTADLSGAELYATSRPCRMCETAAYWARVGRMLAGTEVADAGAPRYAAC